MKFESKSVPSKSQRERISGMLASGHISAYDAAEIIKKHNPRAASKRERAWKEFWKQRRGQ